MICTTVNELTDKFTTEDYPYHNRAKRKALECGRMADISPLAQTVKYADLIDNTSSIVEHDPGFAKVYLEEKKNLLQVINKGNKELYKVCVESINQ